MAQLIFVTGVHDRDALRIASGRSLAMVVNAADHNHIAADPRAFSLDHRTTDGCDVTVNRAFDNHVAAEGNRAFFNPARDSD